MSDESIDPISRPQHLLELTYWVPLVALFVSSLGLIALKRMSGRLPPWAARWLAPPFYLVSLPIAGLVVGMEMLVWIALFAYAFAGIWLDTLRLMFLISPVISLEILIPVVIFFTALYLSGRMLWRTLWNEEHEWASNKSRQRLGALLLLFVFVLAFLCMRSFVLISGENWFLKLRVVSAPPLEAVFRVKCSLAPRPCRGFDS